MKKRILRTLSIGLSLAGVIAAAGSIYAVDLNNRYYAYGVGQRTCDDYIRFREEKLEALDRQHERYTKDDLYEIVDKVIEHWMAGFLTAHDLYVADTYDIAANKPIDDLQNQLEQICRTNPKQRFVEAMVALVQQLNPQRVKTENGQ
jgi:hypothetical protein